MLDAQKDKLAEEISALGEGESAVFVQQCDAFCKAFAAAGGCLTRRLFTAAEGADAHCQVNNLPLACDEILDWCEEQFDGK